MPLVRPSRFVFPALVAAVVACSSNGGTNPGPTATQLLKASGDSQVGNVSATLALPLAVIAKDSAGNPVAGVQVGWSAGIGSVGGLTSTTGADGIASISRTLAANSGVETAQAATASLGPVIFTSFAEVNGAFGISKVSGDSGTDTVLSTLPPMRVHVVDYQNNNVTGYTVNWSAFSGGGSVTAATSMTDGSGVAQMTRVLGATAGTQTSHATVTGLTGSPVGFTATATAGHPAVLAFSSQSATSGAPSSQVTLAVQSRDNHGNPVGGIPIAWAVIAGGGSVSRDTDTTSVAGLATVTHTLADSVRPDTVTATSVTALSGSPIKFATTVQVAPSAVTDSVLSDFFKPDTINIASGGTITWKWNSGGVGHNVTFENTAVLGSNSTTMSGTSTFVKTLTSVAPGTYRFECTIHGSNFTTGMVGVIVVH